MLSWPEGAELQVDSSLFTFGHIEFPHDSQLTEYGVLRPQPFTLICNHPCLVSKKLHHFPVPTLHLSLSVDPSGWFCRPFVLDHVFPPMAIGLIGNGYSPPAYSCEEAARECVGRSPPRFANPTLSASHFHRCDELQPLRREDVS